MVVILTSSTAIYLITFKNRISECRLITVHWCQYIHKLTTVVIYFYIFCRSQCVLLQCHDIAGTSIAEPIRCIFGFTGTVCNVSRAKNRAGRGSTVQYLRVTPVLSKVEYTAELPESEKWVLHCLCHCGCACGLLVFDPNGDCPLPCLTWPSLWIHAGMQRRREAVPG